MASLFTRGRPDQGLSFHDPRSSEVPSYSSNQAKSSASAPGASTTPWLTNRSSSIRPSSKNSISQRSPGQKSAGAGLRSRSPCNRLVPEAEHGLKVLVIFAKPNHADADHGILLVKSREVNAEVSQDSLSPLHNMRFRDLRGGSVSAASSSKEIPCTA
jgi:hypothetical protein